MKLQLDPYILRCLFEEEEAQEVQINRLKRPRGFRQLYSGALRLSGILRRVSGRLVPDGLRESTGLVLKGRNAEDQVYVPSR